MRSGTMAFLAGIVAFQQFKGLPDFVWLIPLGLIFSLQFIYSHFALKTGNWFILGFVWAWMNAVWALEQILPEAIEGKDVQLQGYIANIPSQKDRLWQFEFDIEQASLAGKSIRIPRRIRLNNYGSEPVFHAGDKWRLTVRLKRPHGFMNPGGFDYEQWLFAQGIRATGYVRDRSEMRLLSQHRHDYPLQRLREAIHGRLQSILPEHPLLGVVAALTIGHRDDISQQQWQIFRQTGTNHLVAISGLHIGMVAGLVFFVVQWAWARLGRLPLYLAAPRAAALAALATAAFYAALAGWSLPTQRALIMVAVVMLAVVYKRHVLPSYGLALALLLVLVHDPLAVLSPGFWLSFGAVGLIFLGMQGRRNGVRWWDQWFRVQWLVGLGLAPLLIFFFQQASLVSPVANLFAVPLVSLVVVPLLLIGVLVSGLSLLVGQGFIQLGALLLGYLTDLLAWLGQLDVATWNSTVPDNGLLLISIAAMLIILFGPLRSSRWLGLVCLLPLVFALPKRPLQGEVFFTLLDVGQGLAAVIQTARHTLVFDTGPRFSADFDTGQAVLIPFLRQQRLQAVDTLIVSHGDNDHIGGVASLLAGLPVHRVLSSAPQLLASGQGQACQAGQSWQWDGVIFTLLHPQQTSAGGKENNQSCVLSVRSHYAAVLLPGDIEREAEQSLITRFGNDLRADILVAPHHGSKTSSTAEFISAVQPRYVLFPVGYRNRYHFPYPKVVARYTESAVLGYDTASQGAIQFQLTADNPALQPVFSRQQAGRYWHHKQQE